MERMADRRVWTHNEILDFINTATKFKLVEESDSKKNRNEALFRDVSRDIEKRGHNFIT